MSYGLLQLLGLDVARQDIQGTLFDKLGISGAQQPEQSTQPVQPQVQPTVNVQPPVSDVELAPIPVAQTMNNSQPFTDGIDLSGRGYNQPTMRDINTPTIPTMPPEPTPTVTPEPTPEPSFMDKVSEGASDIGSSISNFWNDPEKMANLTIALNSMRLNPDPNIATAMENKLKSIREMKGGNKTVTAIQNLMNKPGISEAEKYRLQAIIDGVRDGVISPADAYTQALKRESAPLVDFGNDKYYDALKTDIANMQQTWRERGTQARSSLNALNELNTAILNFGETGPTEDVKQDIRVMASKLGMGSLIDEQKMSDGQYIQAIKNRLVAEELRQNKGPQTDFDAEFAGTYIPGLGVSTEANNALMNYSKSVALQQTIFANMSNNIRISDADNAQRTIQEIDNLALMSPAAMKKDDGTWITFNEFFSSDATVPVGDKQVPLNQLSAIDRLKVWSGRYKKVMGFK